MILHSWFTNIGNLFCAVEAIGHAQTHLDLKQVYNQNQTCDAGSQRVSTNC